MNTLGWGPHYWKMLFCTAVDSIERKDSTGVPLIATNLREVYIDFFTRSTWRTLPCKHCRTAWELFNDPSEKHCLYELYSSNLRKFLNKYEDPEAILIWLFCMKRKVTVKLINQEDAKARETLDAFIAKNRREPTKDEYELLMKDILRINREFPTYDVIKTRYYELYEREKTASISYPALFAMAFNAGFATTNDSREIYSGFLGEIQLFFDKNPKQVKRYIDPIVQEHYLHYFTEVLPLVFPNQAIRDALRGTRAELKQLLSNSDSETIFAEWLYNKLPHNVLLYLPDTFDEVIKRYSKWRVACSKKEDTLPTCRSHERDPDIVFKYN